MLAFAALGVAAQAKSHSDDAKDAVAKLAQGGLLGDQIRVELQEYSMVVRPTSVKAGAVKFTVHNRGTMTHEMVLVRAAQRRRAPEGLRRRTASDWWATSTRRRSREADKPGEAEIKKGATVTKTIQLTPGTYVMFCNIDTTLPDGTSFNHFQRGMSNVITAS